MRSKDECKNCSSNKDGWCVVTDKSIDKMYKQWVSSKRSRARAKLKDNKDFFTEERINDIVQQLEIIRDSEIKSIEQINAMNEINAIFYNWKTIHTEYL